jgi:hypothetical protein
MQFTLLKGLAAIVAVIAIGLFYFPFTDIMSSFMPSKAFLAAATASNALYKPSYWTGGMWRQVSNNHLPRANRANCHLGWMRMRNGMKMRSSERPLFSSFRDSYTLSLVCILSSCLHLRFIMTTMNHLITV